MRSTCALLALSSSILLASCVDDEPPPDDLLGETSAEVGLETRTPGQLVAGKAHACVITREGSVRCWGAGSDGQLGDGATVDRFAPVTVSLPARALALAAGDDHTCAALVGGQVAYWGDGSGGQTGALVDQLVPAIVPGVGGVTALAAGRRHTCALHSTGAVSCWGTNDRGQLGDGTGVDSPAPRTVLAAGAPLDGIVAIDAGGDRSCGTSYVGHQRCWGDNVPNQNVGAAPDHFLSAVATGRKAYSMATTGDTSCYGHDVAALAYGCTGELTIAPGAPWLPVSQLDASDRFVCWATTSGFVFCRGANDHGQLAQGNTTPSASDEAAVSNGLAAAVGEDFACALLPDGTVRCWGRGDRGQIGDGVASTADRLTPRNVAGPLAAGSSDLEVGGAGTLVHTCAIVDGGVRCLGSGTSGQLGNGTTTSTMTPQTVGGFSTAVILSAGGAHACAIRAHGTASCWGANASGQLGDTTYTARSTPTAVATSASLTDIAAGSAFTCATRSDGGVSCWGSNSNGQLGVSPISVPMVPTPRNVAGLIFDEASFFVNVEAGAAHVCALERLGWVWCWGNNTYGQAGHGAPQNFVGPDYIELEARDLALGANHTCVLLHDGTVRCLGRNASGQLGDGTKIDRPSFVQPAVDRVVAITAGNDHTCALRDDGTALCWGGNKYGQLGNGGTTTQTTPTAVFLERTRLTSISAGDVGTCAKRSDGQTVCWGLVGQGTAGPRLLASRPTVVAGY